MSSPIGTTCSNNNSAGSNDVPSPSSPRTRTTALLFSPQLMQLTSLLPSNLSRSRYLYSLLHAFSLLQPFDDSQCRYCILKPGMARKEDLEAYHEREYVRWLLDPEVCSLPANEELDDLGLTDDCPPFPSLPAYALAVAGASLTAAAALRQGVLTHALHWDGGRHHAHRARAAGYCYVQDVVLAIQRLRAPTVDGHGIRPRVMYLDLDVHFGDAVHAAFSHGKGVLTLSVHHSSPGFYPASGAALTRENTNDPLSICIPLAKGAGNGTYARVWPAVELVRKSFDPEYLVVQCGLDALAGDPCKVGNLGLEREDQGSLGWMCERVLAWGRPTLWLGGGGYNNANAARAWTYLTSIIAGRPLHVDTDIPDHALFAEYGPSFTLDVRGGMMRDENTPEGLEEIVRVVSVLAGRIGGMNGGREGNG